MKNNVINHKNIIPFCEGSLEILGVTPSFSLYKRSVIFMARSEELDWIRHSLPDFCGSRIIAFDPDGSDTVTIVFSYGLREELRNPRKLLKAIRNKLMGAIHSSKVEVQIEHEEEDREIDELRNQGWPGIEAMDHAMYKRSLNRD